MEMNSTGMQYQTTFPLGFAPAEPAATPQTQTNTIQLAETCRPECTFQRRWSLLNELRQRHEYCDLMLVSSDKVTFQAHSLVLASSSSFLHTAIQTLRSESYSTSGPQKLSIDGVGSDVLGIVLDCLYGVMPSILEDVLKLRMGAEALGLNSYFWPESNKTLTVEQTTIERQTPKSGKQMSNFAEEETDDINARTSDGLPLALAGTSKQRDGGETVSANISYRSIGEGIESIVIEQVNENEAVPPGFEQLVNSQQFNIFAPQPITQCVQVNDENQDDVALENQIIHQLDDGSNIYAIKDNDETDDENAKRQRRKKSRPDLWACNVRKARKDKGEAYVTKSGRLVPAVHRSGPPCAAVCPLRCSKRINEEDCNEIFELFYKLANKNKQDAYLFSLIKRLEPKNRRNSNGVRSRSNSFHYHICKKDGTLIRVCKNAFSSVFGVKESRLARLQNHRSKPATECTGPPVDMRGKHPNPKKTPDRMKNIVRRHILAYIAANKASGQNDSSLRLKPMWLDCIRINEPHQFELLQMGMKFEGKLTQCLYRRIFRNEFKPYLSMNDSPTSVPVSTSPPAVTTISPQIIDASIPSISVTSQAQHYQHNVGHINVAMTTQQPQHVQTVIPVAHLQQNHHPHMM